MTTIITRLYSDAATADGVVKALLANGHEPETIDVIAAGADAAKMRAARVSTTAAKAYAKAMTGGQALVVVRAPFAPMGTARNAMKVVNRQTSIKVGLADEDEYIREEAAPMVSNSVMTDHPFFMSNPHSRTTHGHIFGNGIRHSRPRTSAIRGGAYISTKFWPMKLLTTSRKATSAKRTGWLFSSMFGIPTIIQR